MQHFKIPLPLKLLRQKIIYNNYNPKITQGHKTRPEQKKPKTVSLPKRCDVLSALTRCITLNCQCSNKQKSADPSAQQEYGHHLQH